MSLTQFAMVEELAVLIKDNLPCKHLVLSMEQTLVNFLQGDMSLDGVLELEPMNSYNRLLLHRLAEVFGFSHQSVGEGDDRHLILERCPETSVPSILVSDLLWKYDEIQSPSMSSRRKEVAPELEAETPTFHLSLEKEAVYFAARDRIFSVDDSQTRGPVKQKPRSDPVVARRMIAHALGQRINSSNQASFGDNGEQIDENIQEKEEGATSLTLETSQETEEHPGASTLGNIALSHAERKAPKIPTEKTSAKVSASESGRNEMNVDNDTLKKEHMGAAKRMFAHALEFRSTRNNNILSKYSEAKQTRE